MSETNTARYVARIQEALTELQQHIAGLGSVTQPVSPDNSIGRLSRLEAMQSQQMALAGRQKAELQLTRLQRRLTQVNDPLFGCCQVCEEPIAWRRLEALPDADTCVRCAGQQ